MSYFSPALYYTCLLHSSYSNNFFPLTPVLDKLNANSIFYYHTKAKKGRELPFNHFETSGKQYFSKYMWKAYM